MKIINSKIRLKQADSNQRSYVKQLKWGDLNNKMSLKKLKWEN